MKRVIWADGQTRFPQVPFRRVFMPVKRAVPTEAEIDQALISCRAMQGRTYIFMNPVALTYLNTYKATALQMNVMDTEMNRLIDVWNKTPIMTSYNLGLVTAKAF